MTQPRYGVIVKIGAEGGYFELVARGDTGPRHFSLIRDESLFADFEEFSPEELHGQTDWVEGWHEALKLLDRYPWWKLYPAAVHHDFRTLVLFAVHERGGATEVARWEEQLAENAEEGKGRMRRLAAQRGSTRRSVPDAWSSSFEQALILAAVVHQDQTRKKTEVPYITHPVHVARILERHHWPQEVVLAGILHDVLEDMKLENKVLRDRLRAVIPSLRYLPDEPDRFGEEIAWHIAKTFGSQTPRLVQAVTEKKKDETGQKRPLLDRKLEKLEALSHADRQVAALKAADLLHNIMTITQDLCREGPGVMGRFNANAEWTLWQYGTASAIAWERLGSKDPLAVELDQALRTFERTVEEVGGIGQPPSPGVECDGEKRLECVDGGCVLGSAGRRIYGVAQWLDAAPPREGVKQWKDGRSAKELARAWFRRPFAAVPGELRQLFETRDETRGLHVATALAEWTTPLGDDDEREGRNHDLLLLGTVGERHVVVGIEAKADEEFGPLIGEHLNAAAAKNSEPGRTRMSIVPQRVDRLCQMIFGHGPDERLGTLRYQLLHALAGTVLEAQRRGAELGLFVVHEFVGGDCRPDAVERNRRDLDRFVEAVSPGALPELQAGRLAGPIRLTADSDQRVDLFIGKVTTNVDSRGSRAG